MVGGRAGGWQEKRLGWRQNRLQDGKRIYEQESCLDWAKAQEAAGWRDKAQGTRHEAIDDLSKCSEYVQLNPMQHTDSSKPEAMRDTLSRMSRRPGGGCGCGC